ncbi:MAG: YafY family transcriptional regulator [Flavobacteriales bacterium]|jgi:predicted DNA-binding transcriptional regulator YafY|nr:YafY family transcriptional regulator [Flavobacteriales bacterium]MBK9513756.1 YafY family transcriptional regulator [Flavobacteriales bacterium]MBP7408156.1 YafY family transcriptional regulator [Flavobacteriales bacterium]HOZ39499.1 YafY family protein [Flavobacteriales bacterium]
MPHSDTKRLTRLTAILTRLQTKRLVTAPELAAKFSVSIRTIYRDIRALEEAGIPVITEEGKGYLLMDHYRLPPVAFTEKEANALIAAKQLVLKTTDSSFIAHYAEAIDKITSVLDHGLKDKINLLVDRTQFKNIENIPRTSDNLSELQFAITNYRVVRITYTNAEQLTSDRSIEPFALLSTENWLLVAWCRSRKEFRYFRLDRIEQMAVLPDQFTPHDMTLQQFFERHPGTQTVPPERMILPTPLT